MSNSVSAHRFKTARRFFSSTCAPILVALLFVEVAVSEGFAMSFSALVGAILVFVLSRRLLAIYDGWSIGKLIRYELTFNSVLLGTSLPSTSQVADTDYDVGDIPRGISHVAQSFSFHVFDAYRDSMHLVPRSALFFALYHNFRVIREIGNGLIELLKIEKRSPREKRLVAQHIHNIMEVSATQSDLIQSLKIPQDVLDKRRGLILGTLRQFNLYKKRFDEGSQNKADDP